MKIDKYNFWQRKWVAFMKRNRIIWSPSLLLEIIAIRTSAVTGNRSGLAKRFHGHMRFSHLAWTASLFSSSTLQGDHLQGSWTVLPHGMSSQDHCDYLSLQRSLWLYDDDTPGTMPAYELFSQFLAWKYLGRLAEVAGRWSNWILMGSHMILLDLLDFLNRSKNLKTVGLKKRDFLKHAGVSNIMHHHSVITASKSTVSC